MADHTKDTNKDQKEELKDQTVKQEEKTKISCDVPPWLLKKIDEASRKHADCGRALIIRMALYSFFDIKD